MMLKKLRILVAVSLLIFIFIAGNIFAFGFLQKVSDTNHLNNEPQNNQPEPNTIIADIRKDDKEIMPITAITTNEENQKKDKSVQRTQTTTQSTIKHKQRRRRTRAS